MQIQTPKPIVLIVVGSLALMALTYFITLAICIMNQIPIEQGLLSNFKDTALIALGALTGVLVNTRSEQPKPPDPVPTTIMNTPNQPVPVTEK